MLSFIRPISTPSLAFIRFRPLTVPTFKRQFATAMTSSRLSFRPLDRTTAKGKLAEDFGRKVVGYDPASVTKQEIEEIQNALYSHGVLLFEDCKLSPKEQYELTKSFDPTVSVYGHGTTKPSDQKRSILHPDLKTIPYQPQVQVIGNGLLEEYHGLTNAQLKHPHHKTFHKTVVSPDDEAKGFTRFYRWHIDAALYDLSPPRVTTLYAVKVPKGEKQVIRYDDGTGDELEVPLGTTAFVSGKTMFDILPPALKSLAVRMKVRYAPHPYVWMSKAHAKSTGLGIEDEGLELPFDQLPEWNNEKVKTLPALWKSPLGNLHLQVHPCGAAGLVIEPLPQDADWTDALYPDGATIDDLQKTREILYSMQRPGINPELVYPVDWKDNDLALFHNQGVLHSVVGAFTPDTVRVFHQCNLASSEDPIGPSFEDIMRHA